MKEIIKIKETCLYVNDLEKAREFYNQVLEFDIIHYAPERHIFFRVGKSVLLCFNPEDSKNKSSPPPHYGTGNQHFAFEVSKDQYEEMKKRIISKGIKVIDQLVWKNGQESFYFNDLEQNILEIVPEGVWG